MSPSRMMAIRSPSFIASARSWVMNTIVLPRSLCSRLTSFCISRRIRGSRALKGSSRNITSGFTASARANADALLHATGQLFGKVVGVPIESDEIDHLQGALMACFLLDAVDFE